MAQEQEGADKVLLFQNSTYMFKKKKEGKGAYFSPPGPFNSRLVSQGEEG